MGKVDMQKFFNTPEPRLRIAFWAMLTIGADKAMGMTVEDIADILPNLPDFPSTTSAEEISAIADTVKLLTDMWSSH